jgi:hypothetical protein
LSIPLAEIGARIGSPIKGWINFWSQSPSIDSSYFPDKPPNTLEFGLEKPQGRGPESPRSDRAARLIKSSPSSSNWATSIAFHTYQPIFESPVPEPQIRVTGEEQQSGVNGTRVVLPDGTVEIHYPDGAVRRLTGNREFLILPNIPTPVQSPAEAQPPTPPALPSDSATQSWLDAHNAALLETIKLLLGNNQSSIGNFLQSERALSVYQRIDMRSRLISFLLKPR